MTGAVHVRAPCRLHFGMFGFGQPELPQFGGVGMMLDPPSVELTIAPADRFAVSGQLAERAARFAELFARSIARSDVPPCAIHVASPPDHVGLGVGTQLGLSVAAGLRRFLQLPILPANQLAQAVGRAAHSAVGTLGFELGGLIVDAGRRRGHEPEQAAADRLERRVAVPTEWRVVLVCPANQRGLAGASEADAFRQLPPVPTDVTGELQRITKQEMLPAIERGDCDAFGDAVFRFGQLAGECFAAVQGGPFASAETARLVTAIRERGIRGAGQSSWGPTVFAICRSTAAAQELVDWLGQHEFVANGDFTIARPNNVGATVE